MKLLMTNKTRKGGKTGKKNGKKPVKKSKTPMKKQKKGKTPSKKPKKKSSTQKKRKPEIITIETVDSSIEPGINFFPESEMQMQQQEEKENMINNILQDVHGDKKSKLVLIHANWCGHCQAMKPNWDQMKTNVIESNMYSPEDIIEIESGEQEKKLPELNQQLKGPKIEIIGYPTMGKITDGGFQKYEGGRSVDELMNWAGSVV